MSAFGPKRTFHSVAFDVAFGGKADIAGFPAMAEITSFLAKHRKTLSVTRFRNAR